MQHEIKRERPCRSLFVLQFAVRKKPDDPICLTLQDHAKLFHCEHGDGSVVLQVVDGSGIDAVFIDQGVGGDSLLLHGFP